VLISLLPDAIVLPSGLKATDSTAYLCPVSVLISLPVEISHIIIVTSRGNETIDKNIIYQKVLIDYNDT
jgi:hypothetical protein